MSLGPGHDVPIERRARVMEVNYVSYLLFCFTHPPTPTPAPAPTQRDDIFSSFEHIYDA